MSVDSELLPTSRIEEMVRALVKALRAFQMYLPNNPMYQRASEQLTEAFGPVWEVLDEIVLMVDETRVLWDEEVVYDQPNKPESFAWGLYKDGLRVLALRRGVEQAEIGRFLQVVSRARRLPADAGDDLLTLLWEEEFELVTYQFAEVISDPWVYDPQALTLQGAAEEEADAVRDQVREEVAAARPEGMVSIEDFDSTLYFLDEIEIADLNRQVEREYDRDVRAAALGTLFDVFEFHEDTAVRGEILGILEVLFPNLLAAGEFRGVAVILRELRIIRERVSLEPAVRARVEAFQIRLSETEAIGQLLQALDESATPPPQEELAEVLHELRPEALGAILEHLPRMAHQEIRGAVRTAAERLAAGSHSVLLGLLGTLSASALPGAIEITSGLNLGAAVTPLGALVRHEDEAVRLAAVTALARLGTPGAMTALEPAVDDPARAVRMAAVTAVSERRWTGALRRLESAVTGKTPLDLERAEKRLVFEAYALVAGPTGLETLRGLLEPQGLFRRKAPTDTRTCAVYALGKIRTAESRTLVEELARDKELPVRHAATSLLREWINE